MLLLLSSLACIGPGGDDDSVSECQASAADSGVQVGLIDESCRCEEPLVEIGTGVESFTALTPGQHLTVVHGPQGGWHMPAAIRTTNTRSVVSIVAWVVDSTTGNQVTEDLNYRVQLVDEGSCSGSFPNMYLYLDVRSFTEARPPEVLSCKEQVIHMCVTDTGGNEACGEVPVIADPDQQDIELGFAEPCD